MGCTPKIYQDKAPAPRSQEPRPHGKCNQLSRLDIYLLLSALPCLPSSSSSCSCSCSPTPSSAPVVAECAAPPPRRARRVAARGRVTGAVRAMGCAPWENIRAPSLPAGQDWTQRPPCRFFVPSTRPSDFWGRARVCGRPAGHGHATGLFPAIAFPTGLSYVMSGIATSTSIKARASLEPHWRGGAVYSREEQSNKLRPAWSRS